MYVLYAVSPTSLQVQLKKITFSLPSGFWLIIADGWILMFPCIFETQKCGRSETKNREDEEEWWRTVMVHRMATLKRLVYACVVSAVVLSLLLFAVLHSDNEEDGRPSSRAGDDDAIEDARRRSTLLVDTPGCKIPNIDPFDSTVRHLVTADNVSVVCNVTPPMTYADSYLDSS